MSTSYYIKAVVPINTDIEEAVKSFNYLQKNDIEVPEELIKKLEYLGLETDDEIVFNGEYVTVNIENIFDYEELDIPTTDYEGITCVVDMSKVPKDTKYLITTAS